MLIEEPNKLNNAAHNEAPDELSSGDGRPFRHVVPHLAQVEPPVAEAAQGEPQRAALLTPVKPGGASPLLRIGSNVLIGVGVLLLLYVIVFNFTTIVQEKTTPSGGTIAGMPTTVYLSQPNLDTQATGVAAQANEPQTAATPVAVAQVSNLSGGGVSNPAPRKLHTSRVRRIVAPAINMNVPVVDIGWFIKKDKDGNNITYWQVAEYAAGHHQGSANPGENGNIVVSGHDDWKGEVFKDVHLLQPGDEITLYDEDGTQFLYVVTEWKKLQEDNVPLEERIKNANYMNPTTDQTLTLITCWPYNVDTYRWIVIAKPYDVVKQKSAANIGLPTGPNLR